MVVFHVCLVWLKCVSGTSMTLKCYIICHPTEKKKDGLLNLVSLSWFILLANRFPGLTTCHNQQARLSCWPPKTSNPLFILLKCRGFSLVHLVTISWVIVAFPLALIKLQRGLTGSSDPHFLRFLLIPHGHISSSRILCLKIFLFKCNWRAYKSHSC